MSYHRFETDTAVAAADVRVGDVTHSSPCMDCGDLPSVLTRAVCETPQGPTYTFGLGCACGVAGRMTLRTEHVLSYAGTLAVL
jgi:hypothetical protein